MCWIHLIPEAADLQMIMSETWRNLEKSTTSYRGWDNDNDRRDAEEQWRLSRGMA